MLSEKRLRANARRLQRAFKARYPQVLFGWSYKTNYLGAVCNVLHQEGSWAEVVSNFEYEIVGLLNKYLGISFTDNAGVSNDNRVFIYNNLMDMVNQRFAPSSLRLGSNGSEYYTNRPEEMAEYLQSIGITDFELKSVRK